MPSTGSRSRLEAGNRTALQMLVHLLEQRGDVQSADILLREQARADGSVRLIYGMFLQSHDQIDKAVDIFDQVAKNASETKGRRSVALRLLGQLEQQRNDLDGAIEYFRQSWALGDRESGLRLHALLSVRGSSEELAALQHSIELDLDPGRTLDELTDLYGASGEPLRDTYNMFQTLLPDVLPTDDHFWEPFVGLLDLPGVDEVALEEVERLVFVAAISNRVVPGGERATSRSSTSPARTDRP